MKGSLTFKREKNCIKVYNKLNEKLGAILWDERWDRWVWGQERSSVVISVGCLQEVVEYMNKKG